MAGYLLDTMIVSESGKGRPSPKVDSWLDRVTGADLRISAVTFAEIHTGIDRLAAKDGARYRHLMAWAEELERYWADRIVAIDLAVARVAGRLTNRLPSDPIDALIGATALVHGLTVATRNVRHFRLLDVPVVDPYA
jgi:predicted nucleic acid-binding protein